MKLKITEEKHTHNETIKSWFIQKINRIDKPTARLAKKIETRLKLPTLGIRLKLPTQRIWL